MTTLKASVENVPETDKAMFLNQITKTDTTVKCRRKTDI